jgi:hypothetical protein
MSVTATKVVSFADVSTALELLKKGELTEIIIEGVQTLKPYAKIEKSTTTVGYVLITRMKPCGAVYAGGYLGPIDSEPTLEYITFLDSTDLV